MYGVGTESKLGEGVGRGMASGAYDPVASRRGGGARFDSSFGTKK